MYKDQREKKGRELLKKEERKRLREDLKVKKENCKKERLEAIMKGTKTPVRRRVT